MPSSLVTGPWFRFLNISKKLYLKPQDTAPINPKKGDMYVDEDGVLMIYNGTAFVAVGSQTAA